MAYVYDDGYRSLLGNTCDSLLSFSSSSFLDWKMVNYFHSAVLAPFFSTAELSVNICSSLNGNSNGQAPSPGSIALGNVYRELYLRDLGYFIPRGLSRSLSTSGPSSFIPQPTGLMFFIIQQTTTKKWIFHPQKGSPSRSRNVAAARPVILLFFVSNETDLKFERVRANSVGMRGVRTN